MFNNLNLLFIFIMMISSMISISSNSWLGAWMGLEINLMSFIPLILNSKNIISNESTLKYFMIQTLASSSFLLLCLILSLNSLFFIEFNSSIFFSMIFSVPLIMKLGSTPFQFWFISIMEGLTWMKCFILMTWQKIAPLFILFYILKTSSLIYFWAILSLLNGAISGLNQTSTKKILAYSSVNHIGWLISSLLINKIFMLTYLSFYFFLNFIVILFFNENTNMFNQINSFNPPIFFSISLLSLGGLPPLLGFLPKWMIIQFLIFNNHIFISCLMIFLALITLFFYTRMIFCNLLLQFSLNKWNILIKSNLLMSPIEIMMISTNLISLFLFNTIL